MDQPQGASLLRRAKEGSTEALDDLYRRCAGKLLALIRVRMGPGLRPRIDSRDVLQATLLKSFQRIAQFEGGDTRSLMAWLARIAENEIRDQADYQGRQRRDAARVDRLDDVPEPVRVHTRSVVSRLIVDEQAQALERAIESLEPAYREVVLLRKFEELSFAEIAARMNRSEDACRMLLTRAMVALTVRMREGA